MEKTRKQKEGGKEKGKKKGSEEEGEETKASSSRKPLCSSLVFLFLSLSLSFLHRSLVFGAGRAGHRAREPRSCATREREMTKSSKRSVASLLFFFCFLQSFYLFFFSVQNHRRPEGRKHSRRCPDLGGLLRGGGRGDQRAQEPVARASASWVVREADLEKGFNFFFFEVEEMSFRLSSLFPLFLLGKNNKTTKINLADEAAGRRRGRRGRGGDGAG